MITVKELPLRSMAVEADMTASPELVEVIQRLVNAARAVQSSPVFANGDGPILTSPNGTQYRLVVDNAGTLTTSAV